MPTEQQAAALATIDACVVALGVAAGTLDEAARVLRASLAEPAPTPTPAPAPPVEPPVEPPTEQPRTRIVRTIRLGQTGPLMACMAPVERGEHSTYNRRDELGLGLERTQTWRWQWAKKQAPIPAPRCRLMIDGAPASDWADSADGEAYEWTVTHGNGPQIIYVEAEDREIVCIAVPYQVNDTGAPLPGPARAWVASKRFETGYAALADYAGLTKTGNVAVLVEAGEDRAPVTRPLAPREIIQSSELTPRSGMWIRTWHDNQAAVLSCAWRYAPTGDLTIERLQKYFHSTAVWKLPDSDPRDVRTWAAQGGPRGQSDLMFVCDIRLRGGPKERFPLYGNGAYFLETNGRLGLLTESGHVVVELGLQQQPTPMHSGVKSGGYAHALTHPEHAQAYEAEFVEVADWSQVEGPVGLWEPWGFEVLYRGDDGQVHDRDGHEFWVCDTLHHRIVYADHWTAHSQARFEPAHLPPPWYVQAPGPTGKTTVCNFVGSRDGKPTELCNEPWQIKYRKQDGKLYWTNHAGNSIGRCNLDGSNAEIVLLSSLQPSLEQIGAPMTAVKRVPTAQRATQGNIDPQVLRPLWVRDGPIGEASCVRPTALSFDSRGRLLWIEHYTYAVRRLDLDTGIVETVCAVLDINGGSESSGNNEPTLVIDTEGTFGPVDDIFVWGWGSTTDRRYAADGTRRDKPWSGLFDEGGDLPVGPFEKVTVQPNYGWGLDVHGGRLIAVGSAGGAQMVEVSRRLPTDPVPDMPQLARGHAAYLRAGVPQVALGPHGQGRLGLPTADEMAAWPDDRLHQYLTDLHVEPALVTDCAAYVRWCAVGRVLN